MFLLNVLSFQGWIRQLVSTQPVMYGFGKLMMVNYLEGYKTLRKDNFEEEEEEEETHRCPQAFVH